MKKELAIRLESLEGFSKPEIKLEQYVTPSSLAAEMVTTAQLMGDLEEVVADLGCGTGILAIASSLLGASAIGFDVDINALKIARMNAQKAGVYVDWVVSSIQNIHLKREVTTIMNPPFGIQKKHADRPFISKALEISRTIYSVHSAGSEPYIRSICEENGFEITHLWRYQIPLKRSYGFHEKHFKYTADEVYRLSRIIQ